MKKTITIFLSAIILLCVSACRSGRAQGGGAVFSGELAAARDVNYGFRHTGGSDDYGHSFTAAEAYNSNVTGIFYFLWLGQASSDVNIGNFEEAGGVESTLTGDTVAAAPSFTWWGEPMYGYYKSEDEWVVRKHVELFLYAGLDFICFDCTNNDYYRPAAKAVLDVLLEYAEAGYDVPKAMFMTNTDSATMTDNIYNAFYRNDKYDKIWFCGNGPKPWIIADYRGGDNAAVKDRFYFKAAQWPFGAQYPDRFPWICWNYPQDKFTDTDNGYTIMSVSVAQHPGIQLSPNVNFSLSGLCAPYNYDSLSDGLKALIGDSAAVYYNANRGRGYSQETKTNDAERAVRNVNFDEQWATVFADPGVNLVFITGWNEWIAQKQSGDPVLGSAYGHYVDMFNEEFSRDVEMAKGGYADNCFMQMAANIRRYKKKNVATVYAGKSDGGTDWYDLASWADAPTYCDVTGDTKPRAYAGAGMNFYRNDTGRNDIAETRVVTTDTDVYFLITAAEDITERKAGDTRWMNLFIGVNGGQNGWNGLDYVVNRSLNGNVASIDGIRDGKFVATGNTCTTSVSGRHMLVRVPKAALGITGDAFTLTFKVCDNLQKDFDITELYTNGDCAPIGRINYVYRAK